MAAVPANFIFQIGSIAETVLHDIYYNDAKFHAFITFWTSGLKMCTDRLDYNGKRNMYRLASVLSCKSYSAFTTNEKKNIVTFQSNKKIDDLISQ